MRKKYDPIEEVLALAVTPPGCRSVLDWCPFSGGDSLGDLIIAFNHRCQRRFELKVPGLLHQTGRGVPPILNVIPTDLAHIGELAYERLGRLKVIVLDLDAISNHEEELAWFREELAQSTHLFYLVQVSNEPEPVSFAEYFQDVAHILPTHPEIFQRQGEFEAFLDTICAYHLDAWRGINQNPLAFMAEPEEIADEVFERPVSLTELAIAVRDAAMERELPEEQVVNLAQAAALQESVLGRIGQQLRPYPSHPMLFDAVRRPLAEIPAVWPFEVDDLYPASLLAVRFIPQRQVISEEQRLLLDELGFVDSSKPATGVYFDEPGMCEQLDRLSGVVTVVPFTADWIHWEAGEAHFEGGLSEISLGIPIEESFNKTALPMAGH
jgi:hypothetical protein